MIMVKTKRVPRAMQERIATIIRELLQTQNVNQVRLAKMLDCSQGNLSALLSGSRSPGLNTLLALRTLTQRSIDDLLGLDAPTDELAEQLAQTLELHGFVRRSVVAGAAKPKLLPAAKKKRPESAKV